MITWDIVRLDKVESTNDEARRFCDQPQRFTVVRALRQTAGRGRRGRIWQSMSGNLFFSMALEFDVRHVGHLVVLSALSMWHSIKELMPQAEVWCKWPNDILLHQAKVCGILLEKGEGNYMIVGVGVNIADAPKDSVLVYPTTSLLNEGCTILPDDFLQLYLKNFNAYLRILQTDGFEPLRQMWLDHAHGVGKEIIIKQEQAEQRGVFTGIDEEANLLLQQGTATKKIYAGDVFYIEEK